jgi:hypothetical protein
MSLAIASQDTQWSMACYAHKSFFEHPYLQLRDALPSVWRQASGNLNCDT